MASGSRGNQINYVKSNLFFLLSNYLFLQHSFVVQRHDANKQRKKMVKIVKNMISNFRSSIMTMTRIFNKTTQSSNFEGVGNMSKFNLLTFEAKV